MYTVTRDYLAINKILTWLKIKHIEDNLQTLYHWKCLLRKEDVAAAGASGVLKEMEKYWDSWI